MTKEKLQNVSFFCNFYEWTNSVFERLVCGQKFYKKNNAMQLSYSGYNELSSLGSMFSCALGVSEMEFAKIKDKGKDYEKKFLMKIFSNADTDKGLQNLDIIEEVKSIFDKYELYADFSVSKKISNQKLLNEMYEKCLSIMKKRIEIELPNVNAENLNEYKKHQMFFLKKINYNYKKATKSDGFRFLKNSIIHDIGFCTDSISKEDLYKIADEYNKMADFKFNNNELGKYNRTVVKSTKDKKSFLEGLRVSHSKLLNSDNIEISSSNDKTIEK